jgi:hypothetical protein
MGLVKNSFRQESIRVEIIHIHRSLKVIVMVLFVVYGNLTKSLKDLKKRMLVSCKLLLFGLGSGK